MSHPVDWVKLDKYIELTGDTRDGVLNRRKTGKWLDGVESKIVDNRIWINLKKVDEWIENESQRDRAA